MMDFWTVLGNLTMDYPGLLNTAATPMPGFTKISMAVVQVTSGLLTPRRHKRFEDAAEQLHASQIR
jgi:hypothetical protein